MAGSSLVTLPAETLLQICEALGLAHAPSLKALARANKYCYSVAKSLLFRTVTINVTGRSQLARDVQRCEMILERNAAFLQVRRSVVSGRGPSNRDKDTGSVDESADSGWDYHAASLHGGLNFDSTIPICDQVFRKPDDAHPAKACTKDETWKPLARLLHCLAAMTVLIYACPGQFPPCLLRIVQETPQSRLHIYTFRLRSLSEVDIESHELALATSPNLHSIRARYDESRGYEKS
ncbi:hypothetical protein B0T22DRAFT_386932 [Podospora appendiculata]|uniref:F-box domain-containing protein n=1 Tax=Podospora appendiculata TaxID=314037 RepID=A0AAE0X1Z5_9PEZI|nr:hypothetical protein B0T22DRAFT_386932 [Podospora appendiculata]